MQTHSSSSVCNHFPSKHEVSFLLNPAPSTIRKPSLNHPNFSRSQDKHADDEVPQLELVSSSVMRASTVPSTLSLSGHMCAASDRLVSGVTTGESPSHEKEDVCNYVPDGTKHISLTSGELTTPETGRMKKRRRAKRVLTNLQQKRSCLAARAGSMEFGGRSCCKRRGCFERLDEDALKECIKETLLMRQLERKQRLSSWLCDGVFFYDGQRVCSAFLAAAFGFSRDLQRSVKKAHGSLMGRGGGRGRGRGRRRNA